MLKEAKVKVMLPKKHYNLVPTLKKSKIGESCLKFCKYSDGGSREESIILAYYVRTRHQKNSTLFVEAKIWLDHYVWAGECILRDLTLHRNLEQVDWNYSSVKRCWTIMSMLLLMLRQWLYAENHETFAANKKNIPFAFKLWGGLTKSGSPTDLKVTP